VDGSGIFAVCTGRIVDAVAQIVIASAATEKYLNPEDFN
jgi:hypothetical protein